MLANFCEDTDERDRLNILANVKHASEHFDRPYSKLKLNFPQESSAYEDWRYWRLPHLLEVLEEFPSCRPPAALLIANLTPLLPRFYSISSCPLTNPSEVHLTVAVVTYRAENGDGAEHYGVCSNYLETLNENDDVYFFVRK